MSGLFGGGHSQSAQPIRYNGIQIASSSSGNCLPLLYGRQRLPFNLMWYGNFVSTPVTANQGGKGGGNQQTTSYSYSASFAAGICEGPITSVTSVWNDKDKTTVGTLGMTLFTGTSGQAVWSYLTTNFPSQAIPYDHVCYIGVANFSLGGSAALPNITFEIQGLLGVSGTPITLTGGLAAGATSATMTSAFIASGTWNILFSDYEVRTCTVAGTAITWTQPLSFAVAATGSFAGSAVYDVDPAAMIVNYLTDPNHGVGFASSKVATLSGTNSYASYCQAMGISLSPCETTQRAASDFLKEIFQITNSDAVWSAGTLKVVPYADAVVSGNGVTYTPSLTPIFIFTDDDFTDIPDAIRIATADTFNHIRIEYLNRTNSYNTDIVECTDLNDIALTGERIMNTLSFHSITNSAVARIVGQLILQTSLYERNTLKFKVRSDYCLLEPMDYIGICDPVTADGSGLGYGTVNSVGTALTSQVFRITKVTDSERDEIEIEAMEVPGTVRSSAFYDWQNVAGYNANFGQAPGSVQAPAFFESYGVLVNPSGGRELWVAVAGPASSVDWGGCNVFMSFDNTTYEQAGVITSPSRYGVLNANIAAPSAQPDVAHTLGVTLNNPLLQLGTGTAYAAQENLMLIAVGSGATTEIMSYQTATLVTAGQYNITTLYRGLYNTTAGTHSIGDKFIRLDGSIFSLPVDPGWIGRNVYFKFCSYNNVGRATEDISTVTAYPYFLSQSLAAYTSVSTATLLARGSAVVYSPTSIFKNSAGASAYDSSVWSAQSFLNGCRLQFYVSQTNLSADFGLTTNPLASDAASNLYAEWGFDATGHALVIVGGATLATYTYTNQTLFEIVYDGKHITFYLDGVLKNTINISGQTYFFQACLYSPRFSAYGIDFDNAHAASQPFTLVAMTNAVGCSGTQATSNATVATLGYGFRNFKTLEGFKNGVRLSFYAVNTSIYPLLIGLSTAPAVSSSYSTYFAAFEIYGNTVSTVYSGGFLSTASHTLLVSDVLTIEYDNFNIYWFLNGTLLVQQYAPNAGQLFLLGDMYTTNIGYQHIALEPYGQSTPAKFTARGLAVVADASVTKIGGTASWTEADAYSINGYTTCHIVGKVTTAATDAMLALVVLSPTATINYNNLTFAIDFTAGNTTTIYESGTNTGVTNTYTINDYFAITYDGTNVKYWKNGKLLRTTAQSAILMFGQIVVYSPNKGLNGLDFGTGSLIPAQDTGQITNNAVTSSAGANGGTFTVTSTTTPQRCKIITMPAQNFDGTLVVNASYVITPSPAGGGGTSHGSFASINGGADIGIPGSTTTIFPATGVLVSAGSGTVSFNAGDTIVVGINGVIGSTYTSLLFSDMNIQVVVYRK